MLFYVAKECVLQANRVCIAMRESIFGKVIGYVYVRL